LAWVRTLVYIKAINRQPVFYYLSPSAIWEKERQNFFISCSPLEPVLISLYRVGIFSTAPLWANLL
jgi:hypothetical protein